MAATTLRAQWTLPPEQQVLSSEESPFTLDRVARELTVVMSTSVGDFTPSTDKVLAALESLQSNIALRWCRKVLVFDAVPTKGELAIMKQDRRAYVEDLRGPKWEKLWLEKYDAYQEYCETMRELKEASHPALFNTEFVFLGAFGHLLGTVRSAFNNLDTPYVLVTQHDLRLAPLFVAADVQHVLKTLASGSARYVVLNRDVNSGSRTKGYFRMCPEQSIAAPSGGAQFTAVAGFSDQAHFVEAAWYRREVLAAIPSERRLTCMEHILHDPWKESQSFMLTFLYGGRDDGPFVYDLVHGVEVRGPDGTMGIPAMPDRSAPA